LLAKSSNMYTTVSLGSVFLKEVFYSCIYLIKIVDLIKIIL